jgi:hypothetical protein
MNELAVLLQPPPEASEEGSLAPWAAHQTVNGDPRNRRTIHAAMRAREVNCYEDLKLVTA